MNVVLAIILIVVALIIGAINGSLVAYFHLPAMLVTYGTRQIIRGIAFLQMSDKVVTFLPRAITYIGTGRILGVGVPIWIAGFLTIVVIFILKKTAFGRRFFLVGANDSTANFSGINSKKTIIYGFMINALFAAIRQIDFVDGRVLGVVYNCANEEGKGYGYYKKYYRRYYSRYGYRYEGTYMAAGKAAKAAKVNTNAETAEKEEK